MRHLKVFVSNWVPNLPHLLEMFETLSSLQLGKKLNPSNNPEISWCYLFFPALIGYFYFLAQFLNEKPVIGQVEIYDVSFEQLIYPKYVNIEVISNGSKWSEGPLWIEDEQSSLNYLLYSDTILNRIFRWEEGKGFFTVGKTLLFEHSGCKSNQSHCDDTYEPGPNGLLRLLPMHSPPHSAPSIDLLVCQHGERAISLFRENGTRTFVATHFHGRRFNSPNDLVWSPEGHLYFTDPPYGLFNKSKILQKNEKEIPFSGIYMIKADDIKEAVRTGIPTAETKLLSKDLKRPNGLAFSPDFSKLYVSNAEQKNPIWKVFDVTDNGNLANGKTFFDASDMFTSGNETFGVPDGFKVDINGNLFASGPGGVIVLSPEGQLIGRYRLDRPVSNVAFGSDGRLYFTASDLVTRAWVKTRPARFLNRK